MLAFEDAGYGMIHRLYSHRTEQHSWLLCRFGRTSPVKRFWHLAVSALLLILPIAGYGQPVTLTAESHSLNLSIHALVFEDPSGKLNIKDIQSPEIQEKFHPWRDPSGDLHFGFTSSAWWVKLTLSRQANADSTYIIEVPYAYNRYLDFFRPDAQATLTGHAVKAETRDLFGRYFAFRVNLSEEPRDYYFRVASTYAISLPVRISTPSHYAETNTISQLIEAIYYGILLASAFYAALIWRSNSDPRFGIYALFCFSLNLAMFSANGWGVLFLWPGASDFDAISSLVAFCLALSTFFAFIRSFFKSRASISPVFDRVLWLGVMIYVSLGGVFLASIGQPSIIAILNQLFFLVSVLGIPPTLYAFCQKEIRAQLGYRQFLLGTLMFMSGGVVATLRVYDVIPTTLVTSYALQIGTLFQVLMMGTALAKVIRQERADHEAMQLRLIEQLESDEQRLESAVETRTRELDLSLQRERAILKEYVRFSAMVSHEFRNSLNVISSQADMLSDQPELADQVIRRSGIINQQVRLLAEMTEDWLRSDRTLNVDFPCEPVRIECATWLAAWFAQHPQVGERYQVRYEVIPENHTIRADPGLLSVMLLNLVRNAEQYSPAGTTIQVRMSSVPGGTSLQVIDQGCGIALEHQAKVFERYFRVDPEGAIKGTGIGLALVRHIVDRHGGTVEIQSEFGQGCQFTIWMPE